MAPSPRSRAWRQGRELTLRLLYIMDVSGVSADQAWIRCAQDLLYEDGLRAPLEPLSISIEGDLPAPRPSSALAQEAQEAMGDAWAAAFAVSQEVARDNPAAEETVDPEEADARAAATQAHDWILSYEERREEIDAAIGAASKRWKMARMPVIDRNILRLGAFEILTGTTPPKDAIYDCVELAKRYGDKPTAGFVNGILDQICRNRGIDL